MEQQPDKWVEGLAKYDGFHKKHPCLSTFITFFFHGIAFGALWVLHSAKNGADDVYTGFAEIVIYVFSIQFVYCKTQFVLAEPVY